MLSSTRLFKFMLSKLNQYGNYWIGYKYTLIIGLYEHFTTVSHTVLHILHHQLVALRVSLFR